MDEFDEIFCDSFFARIDAGEIIGVEELAGDPDDAGAELEEGSHE